MSTHAEIRLKQTIDRAGYVELIIVDEREKVTEERYDNFDEAKQAIEGYEGYEDEHTVYF